jgi:hypothetical protein
MTAIGWLLLLALDDRAIGVWRFDAPASTYQSGPAPRESRRTWLEDGGQLRFIHEGVSAAGQPFRTEFSVPADGRPGAVTGSALYDSVVLQRQGARKVRQIFSKGTAVTVTAVRTVSRDGATMVIIARGKRADGKPFRNRLVYRRVSPQPGG